MEPRKRTKQIDKRGMPRNHKENEQEKKKTANKNVATSSLLLSNEAGNRRKISYQDKPTRNSRGRYLTRKEKKQKNTKKHSATPRPLLAGGAILDISWFARGLELALQGTGQQQ